MAAVAPQPDPEDFAARIQAVQAKLAQSVVRAGLKDDAYGHVIDAQIAVLGELAAFVDEVRQVRQPAAVFSEQQVDELARRLAQSCAAWAGGAVRAANRKSVALMLAAVLGAAVVGGLVSWAAFGQPWHPVCVNIQGGGQICGAWTVSPPAASR